MQAIKERILGQRSSVPKPVLFQASIISGNRKCDWAYRLLEMPEGKYTNTCQPWPHGYDQISGNVRTGTRFSNVYYITNAYAKLPWRCHCCFIHAETRLSRHVITQHWKNRFCVSTNTMWKNYFMWSFTSAVNTCLYRYRHWSKVWNQSARLDR